MPNLWISLRLYGTELYDYNLGVSIDQVIISNSPSHALYARLICVRELITIIITKLNITLYMHGVFMAIGVFADKMKLFKWPEGVNNGHDDNEWMNQT